MESTLLTLPLQTDAVTARLDGRPALNEVLVYITCPFMSTSYLVAVQQTPPSWPPFHPQA